MTQEQIEEAAWSYGCAEMTDPATNGPLTKGFIAGVEWYRKALWRNSTDEQPQAGRRILTIEKDGIWPTTMSELAMLVPGVLWCYVEDFIPTEDKK